MKIAVIGTRGFPNVQGGVERHCQQIYPRLAEMGLDITVFTRTPYLEKPFKNKWKSVKFVNLWCPRQKSFETIFHTTLAVIVASLIRPDIIHFHSIGPSLLVPLAKLVGLKVVMTHHGPDYERAKWGWLAKAVLKWSEKWGCKYTDQIIAVSSVIKTQVKEKFDRRAHLITNGVEIPDRATGTDYIESLGLAQGGYVLAVGRFVPEKGLHNLISAFLSLKTDWKLVIAGDADHKTIYSERLKYWAANDSKVVLTGFIKGDALNEVYSQAGLFVLPSYHEGMPIALLEALSYGLSVLVSDIAPNREVGLDENRYFPVGDEKTLVKKLGYWMEKGPPSSEERVKQIEMVKQRYNWDNVARQVLQVYKDAYNK
jgi:glycosyltransferase involved in cell wall biosynthesis